MKTLILPIDAVGNVLALNIRDIDVHTTKRARMAAFRNATKALAALGLLPCHERDLVALGITHNPLGMAGVTVLWSNE